MARYIIKRLVMIIPMLVGVSLFLFFLLALTPGDPAQIALGGGVSEEQVQLFREQHGLDVPPADAVFELYERGCPGRLGHFILHQAAYY